MTTAALAIFKGDTPEKTFEISAIKWIVGDLLLRTDATLGSESVTVRKLFAVAAVLPPKPPTWYWYFCKPPAFVGATVEIPSILKKI